MKRGEAVGHYAPLMKNNVCSIITLGEGGLVGWGGGVNCNAWMLTDPLSDSRLLILPKQFCYP